LLAFLAPLEALDQIFVSLLAVFSRPKAIFVRKYLLAPGLRLMVVLLLVATGAGVLFLAIGYLAAQVAGVFVYIGLLFHVLKEHGLLGHLKFRELRFPARAVFGFSVPLLTGELVVLSINTGNTMLLGMFHGAEGVANYRAVVPAATLNKFVFTSFVTLFLPMAARLFARGDLAGMRRSYWTTAALLAVFTFPVFAMTGPFAVVTTPALFGTRYSDAANVLALLSVGYFVNSALGFNTFTLQVYGRLRFLVILNVLVATLNLAVAFALIPVLGALGAAVATCLTLIVQNVVQQLALCRTIGTAFLDRAFRRPYLAIAATTAALWFFQIALSPPLWLSVLVAGVGSLVVLFTSRRVLDLADTFPELRKLPVIARFLTWPA
jgi:O-antigen/teichoic acid export membrane protein